VTEAVRVRYSPTGHVLRTDDGSPVDLQPRSRALLVRLLEDKNRPIPTSALIETLWEPGRAPADPEAALHSAVSRLRRHLPPDALVRSGAGYLLHVRQDEYVEPHRVSPIVGRDHDIERLEAVLAGGTGVVLVGPAGIGKTTLARNLCDRLRATGVFIVDARGRAASSEVPLAPLAHLVTAPTVLSVSNELSRRARSGSLAVFADDIVDMDPASAVVIDELLEQSRAPTEHLVLLVATHRIGRPLPEYISRRIVGGRLVRHEVSALTKESTHELAVALGAPADRVRAVWQSSRGNPLHALAVVKASVLGNTDTLVDFVDSELSSLTDDERRALTYIAFGEPLPIDVAGTLAPEHSYENLEKVGIVRVSDGNDGALTLAHPLYGEVLRDHSSALLARRIYRELAAAARNTPIDPIRLAEWEVNGGNSPEPALLAAAGHRAGQVGEWGLAEQFGRDLWHAERSDSAALAWSRALFFSTRRWIDAAPIFSELSTHTEGSAREAVLVLRAMTQFFKLADRAGALKILASTHGDITAAATTMLSAYVSDPATVLEQCGPLLTNDNPLVFQGALSASALALSVAGRSAEALALLAGSDVLPAVDTTPTLRLLRVRPLMQSGRFDEAESEIDASTRAVVVNDLRTHAWIHIARAELDLWRGRHRSAFEHSRLSAGHLRATGHSMEERISLQFAAVCAAANGDVRTARDLLAASHDIPRVGSYLEAYEGLALAQCERLDGWLGNARQVLLDYADRCRDSGATYYEAVLLCQTAHLGHTDGVVERLATIAASTDGLCVAMAADVDALARSDPQSSARAARQYHDIGAVPFAVRAAMVASTEFRRSGDARSAVRWADTAASWHRDIDSVGDSVPMPVATAQPLTRREREVAELATRGLRSQDIADRLLVSVRTVDNHLGRIYDKLGVRGRADLVAALV
jgi:DNA-binding CsgD family transcriptional regulator